MIQCTTPACDKPATHIVTCNYVEACWHAIKVKAPGHYCAEHAEWHAKDLSAKAKELHVKRHGLVRR